MSSLEITNELSTETKVIVWKIPDFTQVHKTKSESATATTTNQRTIVEFTAGESLGQPSIWNLELEFLPGKKEIGLYLRLMKSPAGRSVKARFCGSVKVTKGSSDKLVLSLDTDEVDEYEVGGSCWGFPDYMTMAKLKLLGALLDNDILIINVKLIINADNNVMGCVKEILKQNAFNQMAKHFGGLLETGEGSDFIIRVKKSETGEYIEKKVSRNILSSQSSVFEAMLGSPMLENGTGVVTIEDLSAKGLDVLLEFIYTGNLSDDWKLIPEEIANAAEKYNFVLLKAFMDEWLHTACTMDNSIILFTVAKKHGLVKAYKNISEYMKSNFDTVLAPEVLIAQCRSLMSNEIE